MEALARVRIRAIGDDVENVVGREAVELDAHAVGDGDRVESDAVERDAVHFREHRVDKGRCARDGGKSDGGGGAEMLGPARQVESDLVAVHIDELAAFLRFDAGEVISGHGVSFVGRGRGTGSTTLAARHSLARGTTSPGDAS